MTVIAGPSGRMSAFADRAGNLAPPERDPRVKPAGDGTL
jgi:hypothetical protein